MVVIHTVGQKISQSLHHKECLQVLAMFFKLDFCVSLKFNIEPEAKTQINRQF